MAASQFRELLQRLHDATLNGKIRWQETASEDAFRLGLGDGIVRIESVWDDFNENIYFTAVLKNRQGQTIDEFSAYKGDDYKMMDELYTYARASARNADLLVESMLADLEAGRVRELPPEKGRLTIGEAEIPF